MAGITDRVHETRLGLLHVSRITVYLLSEKLYLRILCILTDLEPQVAIDVQNSYDNHEDTWCVWGISKGEHFFLLIVGGAIKAEISELLQQSDLPQGGFEILCVLILEHHR